MDSKSLQAPRAGFARSPVKTKDGVIRKMKLTTDIILARSRREDLSSTFRPVDPLRPLRVRPPPLPRRIDPPEQPTRRRFLPLLPKDSLCRFPPTIAKNSLG